MHRKEQFSLRFRGLSEEMEMKIRTAMSGTDFNVRRSSRRSSSPAVNTLVFDPHEAVELSALYAMLEAFPVESDKYEVWASVVASAITVESSYPNTSCN
jgi:hypothetical protein